MTDEIRLCWHCGAENGPGRGTCGHCNHRLDDDPNHDRKESSMARNLDEFANDLTQVTAQVVQAATQGARTRHHADALVQAAKNGGEDAVRKMAASMSTEDLQRVQKRLSR